MKKISKLFIVFVIAVIFAMGCAGSPKKPESPVINSKFIGTWERVDQSKSKNTLTITSKTIKASNQNYFWNISAISGDTYTIIPNEKSDLKGTIHIKLVGGNLEIIDAYDMSNAGNWSGGEDDWTGKWKKR